jgi:hypothetical protein
MDDGVIALTQGTFLFKYFVKNWHLFKYSLLF